MSSLPYAVYGSVPRDIIEVPADSVQCSPQVPGASVLADMAPASCAQIIVHAPPSTIERRTVLALALRALTPGGTLLAFAANTKGGTRIADELTAFGCVVDVSHKRRNQIIHTKRPATATGLDDAIAAGSPQLLAGLGLWSQPGLFNWDRIDPGSQLLLDHLPQFDGHGADLGCGIGVLARAVRHGTDQPRMTLIDIDQRALAMARRNVPGDGVTTLWADVRTARDLPTALDFIVTNPPFHDAGEEDKALGQAFISKAAGMLKPDGALWLTANRHLPYEATLKPLFETVEPIADAHGFKIYAARKASTTARKAPAVKVRK
ncbi:MAG: class I SAM-dependent methyltransferase [Hyphomicrobium sp.]|nr:class I SAM-dependent methyltransferase [Hyphomicrobium sp.]